MPSQRQLEANRRNGRKGGPNTETGKQRSRLNTLKHGLTSTTLVVLPDEHQHEYDEVLRGFRESFQPHNATEEALVLRLAQAHWRSLRSRRIETGILDLTADTERARAKKIVKNCPDNLNPHNAIAVGFMTRPAGRWQTYLRYDTTISRDFFRTLDALTRLQNARQRSKPPQEPMVAAAAGAQFIEPSFELSGSGIRSVSQNSAALSNEQQTHESNQQPISKPRRTQDTPDRLGRKEKNLPRLSKPARVPPRHQRRASERNNHHLLGRQHHASADSAGLENTVRRIKDFNGAPAAVSSVTSAPELAAPSVAASSNRGITDRTRDQQHHTIQDPLYIKDAAA